MLLKFSLCMLTFLLLFSGILIVMPLGSQTVPQKSSCYTIVDLGPLPKSADAHAPGLSSLGEVAFAAQTPDLHTHAHLWSRGKGKDLGALAGFPDTFPTGINAAGTVVGTARAPGSALFQVPFVWKDGAYTLLDTGEGKYGEANGINDRAEVVGAFTTKEKEVHACLWKEGKRIDLGVPGSGNASVAEGINTNGAIVGASNVTRNGKNHAFLWQNGVMRDLGLLPGGTQAHARAINDRNEVVGWADDGETELHAVVWRDGRAISLPTLGDDPSAAWAVNDRGQIVGASSFRKRMHACLWENDKVVDLNSLIPADSGWTLTLASSISSQGQIAGRGRYRGVFHAFLLTAIPSSSGLHIRQPK